ncbi:hypothetical protein HFN89_05435 [Rhizobium laguerreae]|nr:hypothetical protein [Rhizobium laguerreae]
MNYVQISTLKNLIAAGMMVVVGYCLQWAGMATITERMSSALQGATLAVYDWTAAQATMVQMVYQVDIWYWRTLAEISICWALGGSLLVVGLYRFFSVRAAAIATVIVIIGTFALSAPFTLTDAFWQSASGKPSPAAVTAMEADEVGKAASGSSVSVFLGPEVPSDILSSGSLPLALITHWFGVVAVIFNAIRLALIPVIVVSIFAALIGSLKRRRAA